MLESTKLFTQIDNASKTQTCGMPESIEPLSQIDAARPQGRVEMAFITQVSTSAKARRVSAGVGHTKASWWTGRQRTTRGHLQARCDLVVAELFRALGEGDQRQEAHLPPARGAWGGVGWAVGPRPWPIYMYNQN